MIRKNIFRFVDSAQAINLQHNLAKKVRSTSPRNFRPLLACGMDVAYQDEVAFATAAVYDLKTQVIIETAELVGKTPQHYVPGFLAFREGPLLVKMAGKLKVKPDVFLIDGHGVSHPRRFGIASHVGLALDKPTIGVAKSHLYGRIIDDNVVAPGGQTVGKILTSTRGKKYFVSVGHKISLDRAVKTVQDSMLDGFPAPLRRAHLDSIIYKRRNIQ